ncbi:cytochrome P450 3A29-like [Ptychodera flava]|uniref:cytochrome P450 3A29-like n=1 Tax=Ptychodera flava TaxID=63121 RepID=UPI00396A3FB6
MELFGCELSMSLLLVITVVILLYLYATWTFSTFKNMGIPGPKPWPLFGNIFEMSAGIYKKDLEWVNKYGKVFGTYEGREPVLVIADPEICKQICVKNFASFYNRRILPINSKPLDSGLSMLADKNWKDKRNTLTPAFSGSKMRKMTPIVNNAADTMVKILEKHCEEGTSFQCKDVFGGYVVDSIASAGFGVDIKSQETPDHPFVKNIKEAFDIGFANPVLLIMLFLPFLVPLLNWLDIGFFPKRIMNYFTGLTEDTIAMRKSQDSSAKRVDFLQLMLDAHEVYEQYIESNEAQQDDDDVTLVRDGKSDSDDNFHKGFTNQEILGQALTFFFAGFETTSTLMGFLAYSLATNPDIQEKLCAEIDDVMAKYDEPTYEAVSKMSYLDMVVCEALRMYPPAPRFDRQCTEDITIAGIHIPKGMVIAVALYTIHHNPEIYPDPEKFIPERFTKEEKEKRHPYAWLPFGAGPRNCIGMRFALMEAKIGLVRVFQNFTFEPCAETEIPVQLGKTGFISPKNGIKLSVKSRR